MERASRAADFPLERLAGVSARRERRWGLIGGVVGSLAGVGGFLVGWLVQGESPRDLSGSPYPAFFARRALVVLDYYFLALVLVGLAFLCGGLFALRWGRYPRTAGSGATLVGPVLCALGGVALFMRLWAPLPGCAASRAGCRTSGRPVPATCC